MSAAYRGGKDGSESRAAVGTDSRATSSLDIKGHSHDVEPDVVLLCAGSVCGHCHSGCVPVCAGGGDVVMEPDGAKAARQTVFRQLELYLVELHLVKHCVPGCFSTVRLDSSTCSRSGKSASAGRQGVVQQAGLHIGLGHYQGTAHCCTTGTARACVCTVCMCTIASMQRMIMSPTGGLELLNYNVQLTRANPADDRLHIILNRGLQADARQRGHKQRAQHKLLDCCWARFSATPCVLLQGAMQLKKGCCLFFVARRLQPKVASGINAARH